MVFDPFVSTMTGTWITDAESTDPDYWARHLRRPVRFADALTTLLAEPRRVYLEVGPGMARTARRRSSPRPCAVRAKRPPT